MRDWFNRWILAWLFAAWEFLRDPGIDLNTDFAPEFEPIERAFCVYVQRGGRVIFRAPVVHSWLSREEIELLFIGEGFDSREIIVTEI